MSTELFSELEDIKIKLAKAEAKIETFQNILQDERSAHGQIAEKGKSITIIFPSDTHESETVTETVDFIDAAEFESYCSCHQGRILKYGRALHFRNIEDGDVCTFGGASHYANKNKRIFMRVDAKVLECEVVQAVQSSVGEGAHKHLGYEFTVEATAHKINVIVAHTCHKNILNSTAYVIECRSNPSVTLTEKLMSATDSFRQHIPASDHFKSVTKVIPVLGARKMSQEIVQTCQSMNIWRVEPSASRYTVIRAFRTLAHIARKF